MIQIEAKDWADAWGELHYLYAQFPDETIDRRYASRAFSFNNRISIKENAIGNMDISMVGYSQYKLSLFDKRYIIPGMREEILKTILERLNANRKLTVISYPFAGDDGTHTQGPCLINMMITVQRIDKKWIVDFDIYARIGEITRRLHVDFLKFQELVQYYLDNLPNVELGSIQFHAKALYAESISLTIAAHLFIYRFDKDHWLHHDVQRKVARFNEGDIKFKRGRRIRKAMIKLQKGKHE